MRDNDDFFDKNVIAIMKLIEKNNFSVEIVGGAVRDYILSLKDSKIKSNNIKTTKNPKNKYIFRIKPKNFYRKM